MLVRSTIRLLLLLTVATASFALTVIAADAPSEPAERPAKPERGRRPAVAEVDREAVGFARTHHPELADLLERLRDANPRAYRAAVQDLSRDRVRLERLQERAPERYEYELKLWAMNSHIRLLAARAIRGNADEVRPKLQALMQERHDFRLSRLREERARLTTRMQRVDATIRELETEPPSDADVDALLTRVKSRSPAGKAQKNALKGAATESNGAVPASEKTGPPTTDSQSQTDLPQD